MKVRDKLKLEIDNLDEKYLGLLHNIILQFPHASNDNKSSSEMIAKIFKDIADKGGLGIDDPAKWQQNIRQDNVLPYRG